MVEVKKISKGVYEYKVYRISNCGYHHLDHCIWWEAVKDHWSRDDWSKQSQELKRYTDALPQEAWIA